MADLNQPDGHPPFAHAVERLAAEIMLNIRAETDHFAAQTGLPMSQVLARVVGVLSDMLPKAAQNESDKRSSAYRVRLLLFQRGGLVADTDPEIEYGQPGVEVIRGLQAVGEWAREIVEGYHGQAVEGMGNGVIQKSIKSLRPSLSRNNGSHNWRLKYTIGEEECMANILVVSVPD